MVKLRSLLFPKVCIKMCTIGRKLIRLALCVYICGQQSQLQKVCTKLIPAVIANLLQEGRALARGQSAVTRLC